MKDQKDSTPSRESANFFEKLERATPVQASLSLIAQILLKLKKAKKPQ